MEEDIVCAFVTGERHHSDEDVCEDIAESDHARLQTRAGTSALGTCGRAFHSVRPKSELEIRVRRDKVDRAEGRTTCRNSGRRKLWSQTSLSQRQDVPADIPLPLETTPEEPAVSSGRCTLTRTSRKRGASGLLGSQSEMQMHRKSLPTISQSGTHAVPHLLHVQ